MTKTKICSINMVPAESIKQFYAGDSEILAVNLDNRILCLAGRCTHAGAPLAEGTLNKEALTCPRHGSQFNVTDGSVLRGPTEKTLKVYSGEVRDGFVFIDV